MSINPTTLLSAIPKGLRTPLIDEYNKILKNFRERRWEPTGLNGGKLAEITYTILKGHIDGKFPAKPKKPPNMVDSCRNLEKEDKNKFCRSVRIQIPRILITLYEIRNNRNIGHTGGDVDPNYMDSIAVVYMSKWVLSELVRVFHATTMDAAKDAIEAIVCRETSLIWEVDGKKRVLDTKMSKPDQTLLLLNSIPGKESEKNLCEWVEHSNPTIFRRDVLKKLHKRKFIEYNSTNQTAQISPNGIAYVEQKLL